MSDARPFETTCRGLTCRGQAWGADHGPPVLAIHGWLDNSESLMPLAMSLPELHWRVPDLPGHGHSDHRHEQGTYNLWDDLRDLMAVADDAGWERFAVVGHSRGAMIALLLAVALPERVERAVFLDGFWPLPVTADDAPRQLSQFLWDYALLERAASRTWPSLEAAVASRRRYTDLPAEVLRPLVARNLEQDGDRWRLRMDPRLRAASAFKLTEAHNRAFADALLCPGLGVLGEQGMAGDPALVEAMASRPLLTLRTLPLGHHLQLEDPAGVAACIGPFLSGET